MFAAVVDPSTESSSDTEASHITDYKESPKKKKVNKKKSNNNSAITLKTGQSRAVVFTDDDDDDDYNDSKIEKPIDIENQPDYVPLKPDSPVLNTKELSSEQINDDYDADYYTENDIEENDIEENDIEENDYFVENDDFTENDMDNVSYYELEEIPIEVSYRNIREHIINTIDGRTLGYSKEKIKKLIDETINHTSLKNIIYTKLSNI